MAKKYELKDMIFGELTVLEKAGVKIDKKGRRYILWKCICSCQLGKLEEEREYTYVTTSDLVGRKKDNCGCLTKIKQSKAKKKYNKYDMESYDYGVLWTSNTNKMVFFDKEDYDLIYPYCWYEHIDKDDNDEDGYIEARELGSSKIIKLHRLVTGATTYDIKVDHKKHKLYDNRKSELRISSNQENTMNRKAPKNNTSGVPGVNWDSEKGLWRARLYHENKAIHLGYFETFEEAVDIRNKAVEKYRGEWSYENSMKEEAA